MHTLTFAQPPPLLTHRNMLLKLLLVTLGLAKKNPLGRLSTTQHTHRSSPRPQRQQLDYFLKAHWQKKTIMLRRYERGNENFTSWESYRKSNKVRLQVRKTEWNITPHNQCLPDQYSSHCRDRLPGSVLLPSVCESGRKIEIPAARAIVLNSSAACRKVECCLQQVVLLPRLAELATYGKLKKVHGSEGVSQMFPLLWMDELMMMAVSVTLDQRVMGRQGPMRGERGFIYSIIYSLVSVFPACSPAQFFYSCLT